VKRLGDVKLNAAQCRPGYGVEGSAADFKHSEAVPMEMLCASLFLCLLVV